MLSNKSTVVFKLPMSFVPLTVVVFLCMYTVTRKYCTRKFHIVRLKSLYIPTYTFTRKKSALTYCLCKHVMLFAEYF